MPYRVDPNNNKCVQVKKKVKNKKTWKRLGCTKGSVKNYLAALHANVKDVNESDDLNWADEAANEVPEIRFDDLMVGDVISYAGSPEEKRRFPKGTPEARFNYEETLYHVLSFEDGTTWRNSYQEPEKYMICNLVRLDSNTGNFLSVSRQDIKFPRGLNKPIWSLIYRENVIDVLGESEEFNWLDTPELPEDTDFISLVRYALENSPYELIEKGNLVVLHRKQSKLENLTGDNLVIKKREDFTPKNVKSEFDNVFNNLKNQEKMLGPGGISHNPATFPTLFSKIEKLRTLYFGAYELIKDLLPKDGINESEEQFDWVDFGNTDKINEFYQKVRELLQGTDYEIREHLTDDKQNIIFKIYFKDQIVDAWSEKFFKPEIVEEDLYSQYEHLEEGDMDSEIITNLYKLLRPAWTKDINESEFNKKITPSSEVIKDVCQKEKFCKAQGPITFGQLKYLIESSKNKKLFYSITEGGYKALIRLLPWFIPQIAIAGFFGSSLRAFNKIIKPTIEETSNYKTWWGKVVLKVMQLSEGDLPKYDPISKIFFVSDGLLHMMDEKVKLKFTKYISDLAASMPENEPVPEFFVENELRKYLNEKFLLDPPLGPKTMNESENLGDLNWADEINPLDFSYQGKELFFDIRELNPEELGKLYNLLLPYMNKTGKFINHMGEEISWNNNTTCFQNLISTSSRGTIKSISLHCGINDNDYLPLKGAICCINGTYKDEPDKTHIIPINAKDLFDYYPINESEWFEDAFVDTNYEVPENLENVIIYFDKGLTKEEWPKFLKILRKNNITYLSGDLSELEHIIGQDYLALRIDKDKTLLKMYLDTIKLHSELFHFPYNELKNINLSFIEVYELFSRAGFKLINGHNLIGESVINESEWFEDVAKEPIILKTEELEVGDIVIPTCFKEEEYIVTGKGTSVKLLHEPTHWVTLKRNTKTDTGGVFLEHDTEMGRNCRFTLVHRENLIEESEENDDLFWADEMLKSYDDSIDITGNNEQISNLKPGDFLKITGYQDNLDIDNDCKIVDFGVKNRARGRYLVKFKKEMRTHDNIDVTHCGPYDREIGSRIEKDCDCRRATPHDEPHGSSETVGKCWFVDLNYMDKVLWYPNRIDLVENKKTKKPLLTEGRYDAITRKVVKDIINFVTSKRRGSFSLPYDMTDEFEYEQEGLSFSIDLDIKKNRGVKDFHLDAAVSDDKDENVIMVALFFGPDFSPKSYEKLFYRLQEVMRHEIEHLTQGGPNRIPDRPIYYGSTSDLKTVYGHHKNKIEVPALVHGFYRRAKIEKRPLDEIMIDDLDADIQKGLLSKKQAENLLTIWLDYAKKNLPAARYSK